MNISRLGALAKLISANPNEAKALIKLVSVDILKSLGDGKYTVTIDGKELSAKSDKALGEGARYWAQSIQNKNSLLQLSNLVKQPLMLQNLKNSPIEYSIKDLQTLLSSKDPHSIIKQNLLEHLSNANTKDEFTNISALLLSIQNNTLSIPLNYHGYFSVLQFKKRYNKKNKKTQIDFYAALEFLGPVSGVILLENNTVSIELSVAYDKTKRFLEDNMNDLAYDVNITVIADIEPLYSLNSNSILDISI